MIILRTIALLFLTVSLAHGQKLEPVATVGAGSLGAEDTGLPAYVNVGVEVCGVCSPAVLLRLESTTSSRKWLSKAERSAGSVS